MSIKKSLFSKIVLAVLIIPVSVAANSQTAGIALSESSAQLGYGFLFGSSSYGRNEFKMDFLFNSKEEVYLLSTGAQVFDEVGSNVKGLTAGLGGKLYGATAGDVKADVLSIGIGGMLRYAFPHDRRLIFGLDGYYAPPVISFLDADRFYEVAARVEYEVLPTASIFLEYRQFTLEKNDKEVDLEARGRLGLEIDFGR